MASADLTDAMREQTEAGIPTAWLRRGFIPRGYRAYIPSSDIIYYNICSRTLVRGNFEI